MDSQLSKSLIDLIDETLFELEELRKSRFSAAEIKIEGPGEGIAGKPADGALDAKKAEDEDEDDDMDKAEDCDDMDKAEDEEDEEKEEMDKAEKKKKSAAPSMPSNEDPADSAETQRKLKSLMNKGEDEKEEDEDEEHPKKKETKEAAKEIEEEAKEIKKLHKSLEKSESLMKSYVEERIKPLEEQLSTILNLVNKIADQPVAPKGVSTKTAPLFKSEGEYGYETLSKAQVANKLFELKKSGTRVDSLDIAKAEMGQDLVNIIKKYEIS